MSESNDANYRRLQAMTKGPWGKEFDRLWDEHVREHGEYPGSVKGPTVAVMTVTMPGRVSMVFDRARELYNQSYRIREWVIAGDDLTVETLRAHWDCKIPTRFIASDSNLPTLRNECVRACLSDIIVQVDDDDWQHPTRVERQVKTLQETRAHRAIQVVGSNWVYAYWRKTKQIHRIAFWNALGFIPGATLAYWREAWESHPFDETATMGEDGPFVRHFFDRGVFLNMREPTLILYNRHGDNTSTDELYLQASRTGQRRSPHEILEERRRHPGKALPLQYDDSALDAIRLHDAEVNRLFWREEMGLGEFARFTGEE